MGIDISTRAELPRVGLFRRLASRDFIFRHIQRAVTNAVTDELLRRVLRFERYEHTLLVELHPAGPAIEFTWNPDGYLRMYTKTSTTGPGFHGYVLELLDQLTDQCRLVWDWSSSDSCGGPTGMDFDTLQKEMSVLPKAMAQSIREFDEATDFRVNMPIDYPFVRENMFVISPMGPFSWKWWEELSYAEGKLLEAKCEEFFPWWHREQDAIFWRNFGLVLLWMDVPWHVPTNQEEREKCQLAIDCLHRARALDPDLEIPETEIKELEELLQGGEQESRMPPRQEGVGFHRSIMGLPTTGGWSVDLPGYYYTDWVHDGRSQVFWFGGRTLHISSFTVAAKDGQALSKEDLFSEAQEVDTAGAERVAFEKDHLLGEGFVRLARENGREYWELRGVVACGEGANTVAIVTICYDDPADEAWAISTFKTVFHPMPGDEVIRDASETQEGLL